jgi:hypothetical protein
MDPKVSKGILAIAAAVTAAAGVWFAEDPLTQQAVTGLVTFLVGWLCKTPGDMRMRPLIERDAP